MDRIAALRDERNAVLQYCRTLTTPQWDLDSTAAGWRIRDVVAHMGGIAKELFTPRMLAVMASSSIERYNDGTVERRRYRTPDEIMDEYERWSRRLGHLLAICDKTPLGATPFKLSELGLFPMRLITGAVLFDTHTHLRHDIAPVLGLLPPPTDANRMSVVIDWMVVCMQRSHPEAMQWLDRPIGLTLTGPGGGTWRIERGTRGGRLTARPDDPGPTVAHITGLAEEFPIWGTKRADWRGHAVDIDGDAEYGSRFLDSVNIV
jgi:uncharacterized protein (TIGR03083 family)